jgi:hypothetical protein
MVLASALLMSVGLFDVRNCRFRFLPLTTDVLAPVSKATMRKVGAILPGLFSFRTYRKIIMKKTDAALLLKKAERQIANTSGGGHLGGTNHGQGYDAKTTGAHSQGRKSSPRGGSSKK